MPGRLGPQWWKFWKIFWRWFVCAHKFVVRKKRIVCFTRQFFWYWDIQVCKVIVGLYALQKFVHDSTLTALPEPEMLWAHQFLHSSNFYLRQHCPLWWWDGRISHVSNNQDFIVVCMRKQDPSTSHWQKSPNLEYSKRRTTRRSRRNRELIQI